MKFSKMRCALARLFPANTISSIRCPSLLHFSTLYKLRLVGVERVVGFSLGPVAIALSAAIGVFAKQRSAWRGNQSRVRGLTPSFRGRHPCAQFGEQYLCSYAGARGDVAGGMSRIAKHGRGWPLWVLTPPPAPGGDPDRGTAAAARRHIRATPEAGFRPHLSSPQRCATNGFLGRLEAERRQVTVLFTDMVGFTSFSERSGEEAALHAHAKSVEADGRSGTRARRRRSRLYTRRYSVRRLRSRTRRFGVSFGAKYPSTAQGSRT
jgi:hypothetical protein